MNSEKQALLQALEIPIWLQRTVVDVEAAPPCSPASLKKAKIMIIGEASELDEDQQGEFFVGRAGQLFDAMLHSIGLERSEVSITNLLKYRQPNAQGSLSKEIALIQPTVLCVVGITAAHYLLNTTQSLSELRGKVHVYGEEKRPLIITYHPAYLLRKPAAKSEAYQDLCQLKSILTES